jgi:hypothetical protein
MNFFWTAVGSDITAGISSDQFGASISASDDGTVVAIGAPGDSTDTGKVRVYQYASGMWSLLGSENDLVGDATNENFGQSVSLRMFGADPYVAIGAPGHVADSGRVQVWKYASSTWSQVGSDILGAGTAASDRFGESVALAIDGTDGYVAIGAPHTAADDGEVEVYSTASISTSPSWSIYGSALTGASAGAEEFGTAVGISTDGQRIVVGSPAHSSNLGRVQVYSYSSGWFITGSAFDGEAASDAAGSHVSISGDGTTIAYGAAQNDGGGAASGSVRVYRYSGSWSKLGDDIDGVAAGALLASVALSDDGNRLVTGATVVTDGYMRVHDYVSSSWVQKAQRIQPGTTDSYYGYAVAYSDAGGVAFVADAGITNQGAVYAYNLVNTAICFSNPMECKVKLADDTTVPLPMLTQGDEVMLSNGKTDTVDRICIYDESNADAYLVAANSMGYKHGAVELTGEHIISHIKGGKMRYNCVSDIHAMKRGGVKFLGRKDRRLLHVVLVENDNALINVNGLWCEVADPTRGLHFERIEKLCEQHNED